MPKVSDKIVFHPPYLFVYHDDDVTPNLGPVPGCTVRESGVLRRQRGHNFSIS